MNDFTRKAMKVPLGHRLIPPSGEQVLTGLIETLPRVPAPPGNVRSMWESTDLAASFGWFWNILTHLQLLWEDKVC